MDNRHSLELIEAFRDFIDMGIEPSLTLLDTIHSTSTLDPHVEAVLFGGIGTYLHTLKVEHLNGHPPIVCHQLGVLAVCQDARIYPLIDTVLNEAVIGIVNEKLEVDSDE